MIRTLINELVGFWRGITGRPANSAECPKCGNTWLYDRKDERCYCCGRGVI